MIGRRAFLAGLGGIACSGAIVAPHPPRKVMSQNSSIVGSDRDFRVTGETPLRDRAAAKGLLYGAAGLKSALSQDLNFASAFARECGILVAESAMKWDALRPDPERFNFTDGDWLAEFAQTHKMRLRGHTLVWHHALPPWFKATVTANNAEAMLRQHIQTVVSHYAGQMHSWDVVNEAIAPRDDRPDGLRNSPWLELLGSQYIDLAFRAAAAADPKALLVYNDYSLDYDTAEGTARRTATLNLLKRLKDQGTPVQALGIQAHLNRDQPRFNPEKLQAFLRSVADLDLKILITELDVTDKQLPRDIVARDRAVAVAYEDYLNAVLAEPAVIAVLTWGLSDRYTWLSSFDPRIDGAAVRPLPLDAQLQRKPAWAAMARVFDQAPDRTSAVQSEREC